MPSAWSKPCLFQKGVSSMPLYSPGMRDGNVGLATIVAVQKLLKRKGYAVRIDGNWGDETSRGFQQMLSDKGFYHGPIDGQFLYNGDQSIKALQKFLGCYVDGKFGPATKKDLQKLLEAEPDAWPFFFGPTDGVLGGMTILALQKFLLATGDYKLPCDGVWGDGTAMALQMFLAKVGLYHGSIDGQVLCNGEQSIKALQMLLGCDVTGTYGKQITSALQEFLDHAADKWSAANKMPATPDKHALEHFKKAARVLVADMFLLTCPELMKKLHGFTLAEMIAERRHAEQVIHDCADHLDEVAKGAGIAQTAAGGTELLAGTLGLVGMILAPVSGGTSLMLTTAALAGGIAGSLTSSVSGIVKAADLKDTTEKLRTIFQSLQAKEAVVYPLMTAVAKNLEKLRNLYSDKSVQDFFQDTANYVKWAKGLGVGVLYGSYNLVNSTKAAWVGYRVAQFIETDAEFMMQNLAAVAAAPGSGKVLNLLGITFEALSPAAKTFAAGMQVANIVFGAMDLKNGIQNIKGSGDANHWRDAGSELRKATDDLEKALGQFEAAVKQGSPAH